MYTKNVLKEQEIEIINLFNKGLKAKTIPNAVNFNLSYQRTLKVLHKFNLKTEGSGGKNRKINYNPFIGNTDEIWYWLGYIASDGCLSSKKYSIAISSTDVEHILKFNKLFNNSLTIYDYNNKAGNLTRLLRLGNKEIHSYLISLGITPKKSKTLKLNFPLNGSFLRGIFDGDGSIAQNRPKITSASKDFINQISEYFKFHGIDFTVTVKNKVTDKNTYDIWVLKNSRKKFYDLMYTNSTVFLERKQEKYWAVIQRCII